ncbi:hypothetical protein J7E62_23120 [Variovorax paradoxus]|nr:hypothetical protein [Variovorax paradoxus]
MGMKAARREYLQALAEFDRAIRNFAQGMADILPPEDTTADLESLIREMGPSKPSKRARRHPGPSAAASSTR